MAALGKLKPVSLARWQWTKLVVRESRHVNSISATLLEPRLVVADFSSQLAPYSREYFFILANGDSVNDLTKADFDFMRPYFSVGLNAWPIHPFTPSAYGFELWTGLDRHDSELEFLVNRAFRKTLVSGGPIWMLRPKLEQVEQLALIMTKHPGLKLDLYGRVNLGTNSRFHMHREITRAIAYLANLGKGQPVLLDNGSSVVRMISLALLHGFKRVVLVGVDLTETPYFWYNKSFMSEHGDYTNVCRRQPNEGADTIQTRNRPYRSNDFIQALARVAQDSFDSEVLVSSPNSALSGPLGVFRFGQH